MTPSRQSGRRGGGGGESRARSEGRECYSERLWKRGRASPRPSLPTSRLKKEEKKKKALHSRKAPARPAAPAPARSHGASRFTARPAGSASLRPPSVHRLLALLLLVRRCPASWAVERPSPPSSPARARRPRSAPERPPPRFLQRGRRSKVCVAPQRQRRAGGRAALASKATILA